MKKRKSKTVDGGLDEDSNDGPIEPDLEVIWINRGARKCSAVKLKTIMRQNFAETMRDDRARIYADRSLLIRNVKSVFARVVGGDGVSDEASTGVANKIWKIKRPLEQIVKELIIKSSLDVTANTETSQLQLHDDFSRSKIAVDELDTSENSNRSINSRRRGSLPKVNSNLKESDTKVCFFFPFSLNS